jgi:peptide/nickel transport system permease protein
MSLGASLLRRLAMSGLILLLVAMLSYWVLGLISPNQPSEFGLAQYLLQVSSGNLGQSQFYHRPNLQVILQALPATFELALITCALVIAAVLPLGLYTAIAPQHKLARSIMAVSLLGISLPVFLTGSLMVYFFAVELNWLPTFGRGETVAIGPWQSGLLSVSGWQHIMLPAITLSLALLPLFLRLLRAELLQVMHSNPVRLAQAMGVSPWRIWLSYGLRNATLPMITMAGLQFGTLVAYTIVAESLFQWPGAGSLFMQAINRGDGPLVAAYLVIVAAIFLLISAFTDLAYGLLNPHLAPWHASNGNTHGS